MTESLPQIPPKSDGSNRSLDSHGDLTLVYDSTPIDIEKERDMLNKEVTATAMHDRAISNYEQLSF